MSLYFFIFCCTYIVYLSEYIKNLSAYDLATLLYCACRDSEEETIDIDGCCMPATIGDVEEWLGAERTE